MKAEELARLRAIASKLSPVKAEFTFAKTYEGGMWFVGAWSRRTHTHDVIKQGPLRCEGPTGDDAKQLADVVNGFPALISEIDRLRQQNTQTVAALTKILEHPYFKEQPVPADLSAAVISFIEQQLTALIF